PSNRTGLIHSEQMVDLEGSITLDTPNADRPQVSNGTLMDLAQAIVLRKTAKDEYELAWIGELGPGELGVGQYKPYAEFDGSQYEDADNSLDMQPLLAHANDDMGIGDIRLIAITHDAMGGMQVIPPASQKRGASLIVAHLHYQRDDLPVRDENWRLKYAKKLLKTDGKWEPENFEPE
ncbi:MAG: hypothetical protein N2C12_13180, partial [Planctomycetales bacterium]